MDVDTTYAAFDTVKKATETQPITMTIKGALTPAEMLKRARAAGKTAAEINAFAASQPMMPVAIKGTRVFVQDCFGRTFGLDNIPDKERTALVAKGVPYTPYSNRQERRADVRAQQRAKKRSVKSRTKQGSDTFSEVASQVARSIARDV